MSASAVAIVYVRQSSPGQLIHNQESNIRQYALVDRAHDLGFKDAAWSEKQNRWILFTIGT